LIPDEIKAIRERAGLSQKEMGERLGVGEKTYIRWENGHSIQNKSIDNMIRCINGS
jgi:transcriptional regulator with XRE-family HTH domain